MGPFDMSKCVGKCFTIIAAIYLSLQLVHAQDVTKAFETGDENHDGKLSKKELRSAMATMGIIMNKGDSILSSNTHDVNSDNRIDMAEFQTLAATEQNSGVGRLCRRCLEAAGMLGLVEASAHYIDMTGLAVSPPGYTYFTVSSTMGFGIYIVSLWFASKYSWFVKHRVYVLAAAAVSLFLLAGVLFAIEFIFGDEDGKKRRTSGKGRQAAK